MNDSMNDSELDNDEVAEAVASKVSDDMLIIVPVRNLVLFPGTVVPVAINRERSLAAAQEAVRAERKVGFVLQHDPDLQSPTGRDLHKVGTVASIVRYVTSQDGTHHLVVQGERRFRVLDWQNGLPFMVARVEFLTESPTTPEIEARALNLKRLSAEAVSLLPQAPAELANAIQAVESPSTLADLISSFMDIKPNEKQELLENTDLKSRLDRVAELLTKRIEVLRLQRQLEEKTRDAIDERHKEALLREQLRQIRKELGEDGESGAEIAELKEAIEKAGMPPEAREQAEKELKRLERMSDASAEYSLLRTWLDWMLQLPWAKLDAEAIEIERARRVLDEDHYGLDKIKRRIVEYLAVRKLNPQGRSPILCFVGPPGVGKTSLGQSIARALGVKFARVSLGGVHDEAEIRGHRRTYIGALPGNIVQALRKAGTRNSVLMLDEIDKLGAGIQGDPSAALLEVLDPEQNNTFRDNYLGVPFDLSNVIFMTTANVLDTIQPPLRDRMEVIRLAGYTEEEKREIARRHLLPKQMDENGITPKDLHISKTALTAIIQQYTQEAGLRQLEREIGRICRKVARRIAEGHKGSVRVSLKNLHEFLGAPKIIPEEVLKKDQIGVATGLAWTAVGGDVLFVEALRMNGKGNLVLTGQLGEVMRESAQAAYSYAKSRAKELEINENDFNNYDLHIHIPEGAIPKDGPSAGITLATAMVSALSSRPVRKDVAMTGEITLRGNVLPIGGVKEKVLAARRARVTTIILPQQNRRDLDEVPKEPFKDIRFVFVDNMRQVFREALGEKVLPPVSSGQRPQRMPQAVTVRPA